MPREVPYDTLVTHEHALAMGKSKYFADEVPSMRIQLVGLGTVGRALVHLIDDEKKRLKSLGFNLRVVSVSDSKGTAIDEEGLNLTEVLEQKRLKWKSFDKYVRNYTAMDAIKKVSGDVVVETTPSTTDGEPGLSHIEAALATRKNVVTANKGPLVVAHNYLKKIAEDSGVQLLHEATVAGHLPIFCLVRSCFRVDEILKIQGILNATTNFMICEIERGRSFRETLDEAIREGWAEPDYSDDIDGIDSARKVVILANSLFGKTVQLKDVEKKGIRDVEALVKEAKRENKKVKLICEVIRDESRLKMSVTPRKIPLHDPLATVGRDKMGIKFFFKTSQEVFISTQSTSPRQTAYAILNDIAKVKSPS